MTIIDLEEFAIVPKTTLFGTNMKRRNCVTVSLTRFMSKFVDVL